MTFILSYGSGLLCSFGGAFFPSSVLLRFHAVDSHLPALVQCILEFAAEFRGIIAALSADNSALPGPGHMHRFVTAALGADRIFFGIHMR